MKDVTKVIIVAIIAMTVMFVSAMWAARAETYPAVFVVYKIDRVTDTLTLIDFNGWMWDVCGVEDFEIGDVVGATMDDMGTEIIYDDEIQYIRYCGWLEGWK